MQQPTTTIQTQRRDVVMVPRQEYQAFRRWHKSVRVNLDEAWFWTPEWQRKEAEADEAIRRGKVVGPFSDVRKLLKAIKSKRK